MSGSGFPQDPAAGGKAALAGGGGFMEKLKRFGLTERQQRLNHNWSVFRVTKYDIRAIDWDGTPHMNHIEAEAVMRAQFIPPGFYDAGQSQPIKFRRPRAQYPLPRVVVKRFSGLLFSERRHPQIRFEGDAVTEDFVQALAETARLWPTMMRVRDWGGGAGSACIGYKFVNGKPIIEVFDPRWCEPVFIDENTLEVKSLEIRYIYPKEIRDPETNELREEAFWYRRVITSERDTLWKPIVVDENEEPDWDNPDNVAEDVAHGLPDCPVVWIPNERIEGEFDGDPDWYGIEDMVEDMDALFSQASKGTIANSDPTVVVVSEDELPELTKGSENAIKLTKGDAKYMELTGSGPKAARELAHELRALALEVASCVLDHPQTQGERTATEVDRVYDMMWAKADTLRENYGEQGVKRLLEKMLRAAARLMQGRVAEDGVRERGTLTLPPKIETDDDGNVTITERKLGPYAEQGQIKLLWPQYKEPAIMDIEMATRAAGEAIVQGLIDLEHAVNFLANMYRVEDVPSLVKKLEKAKKEAEARLAQQSIDGLNGMSAPRPQQSPSQPKAPGGVIPLFQRRGNGDEDE